MALLATARGISRHITDDHWTLNGNPIGRILAELSHGLLDNL